MMLSLNGFTVDLTAMQDGLQERWNNLMDRVNAGASAESVIKSLNRINIPELLDLMQKEVNDPYRANYSKHVGELMACQSFIEAWQPR